MGNAQPSSAELQVWDPGKALLELKAEQDAVGADTNDIILAEERLRRAGPMAAEVLTHLMQFSSNERIRLQAANAVLDRVLGKVGGGFAGADGMDPFEKLLSAALVSSNAQGLRGERSDGGIIEVTSSHPDAEPPVRPSLPIPPMDDEDA